MRKPLLLDVDDASEGKSSMKVQMRMIHQDRKPKVFYRGKAELFQEAGASHALA